MAKNRLFVLFLSLFLAFNMCAGTVANASENKIYVDPENEFYAKTLDKFGIFSFCNDEGIFFGDSNGVKRAEAAKALASLLGYGDLSGTVSHLFIDVPDHHEYAGNISTVVELGLMIGTGSGEFSPDSIIKVEHFIKSIVIALGYDYKAQGRGGYPSGYVTVAHELKLLNGVKLSLNDDLSREALIRILYNALEVEIPILIGIVGDGGKYKLEEGCTVLTEYHDIYCDEGVVKTNDISAMNPYYAPSDENVVIGSDIMQVGYETEIFNYLGYEVRYFYKKMDNDKKRLIVFEETSENDVLSLTRYDMLNVASNEVTYEKENGAKSSVYISSNASVFYNGKLTTTNIEGLFESFADRVIFVDNDSNNKADVVFVENYIYDVIEFVNVDLERIYLKERVIDYSSVDYISIKDISGKKMTVSQLSAGSVVGFGENIDDTLVMYVIGEPKSAKIKSVSDYDVETEDGATYRYHKNLTADMLEMLKPSKNVVIASNGSSEIVWVENEDEDGMKMGYLIKTLETKKSFGEVLVRCDILDTSGVVTQYIIEEKLVIDGTRMKCEDIKPYMRWIKETQNSKADGETSQVVYYKTDDNGVLKQLYTAGNTERSMISMVYNSNERGKAALRDHGYGVGVFSGTYAMTNEVPVFKIPDVNLESYDDRYFAVGKYGSEGLFKDGGLYDIDIYKDEATDIMPSAVVMYTTASLELNDKTNLFLVEETVSALNPEEEVTTKVKGYYDGERKEYYADTSLVMPELSPGDVCAVAVDQLNTIIAIDKVYDFETDTVSEKYAMSGSGTSINGVGVLHVYNAPANSRLIEAFKTDFSLGVPGDEKKILINTRIHVTSKNDYTFDIYTDKGKIGIPDRIIDYLHDETGYARVLVRYDSGYQKEAIYYQ